MAKARITTEGAAGPASPKEGKADRFQRLARKRVAVALKHIRRVGQLANRRAYDYTPIQAEKIMHALTAATQVTCNEFTTTETNGELFDL